MTGFYAVGEVATGSTSEAPTTDTTAPTLTAASAATTGPTTATGSVTTNEAGGMLYGAATASATATASQVQAGISKAVTAAGAQSMSFTGLTASTPYYPHYVHVDAAGNVSAVANGASFTTAAPADSTGPVMQGAISFTKTAVSISLSWPAATDASGIAAYFISKDGNTAVSNGTARTADFASLSPLSTHQFVITATDPSGNLSSNSLTVTVQTDAASGTYATYVEETFVDSTGALRANLTGMRWYVWAETGTTPLGAPIGQGNVETTDANGLCHFDISGQTSVMPGAPVRLGFTNDSGDPGQAGLLSWFGTVLAH